MTPDRWQRIKSVLQSALELQPHERSSFLDAECDGDDDLRTEVESLIASHEQASHFIEAPAYELMAESLRENDSIVGHDVGPYRIIERVGAGGMGEVYVAEDGRLGRRVALKILLSHYTRDDERVWRFQREARAASALNHPNILTIHEVGEFSDRYFIITELIEGSTLRKHIATNDVTCSEALDIAIQIASALGAAHAASIVHRDIKPENVMVRSDGIVKVLDFGLAKLTEPESNGPPGDESVNTQQGIVMGTSRYMSPEQARGLPVDGRTDIWSLGVVLYEMIDGRTPFDGATTSDVIACILHKEPSALSRHLPDIPIELDWILSKALRKDRDERYQTVRELVSDLKRLKRKLEFEHDLERSIDRDPNTHRVERVVSSTGSYRDSLATRSAQVIDTLAVLPLINQTRDSELEYFTDGITETLINSLSQLPELRVMAWSTVAPYKSEQPEPRQAGRDLGVRAVLIGRLTASHEHLLIKTELVDCNDGSHLWGESYRSTPSDIIEVEKEISRKISENLLIRLTTEERKQLAKRYTKNVDAYHAYLKGRHFWNKRTEEGVRRGIDYFKQAIDIDPSYALAYTGLADSYFILGGVGVSVISPHDAFPKAREAATKALEIDDLLAEAHASLANALVGYYWDWAAAEKEFKRCLDLKPAYATGRHWYAFLYLTPQRRFEEAISHETQAYELEPLSLAISSDLAMIYYAAGNNDRAIAQFQRTLDLDQSFVYTHWQLGLAYEEKGMYEEAISHHRKAVELSGESTLTLALLTHAYAASGQKGEALKLIERLTELSKQKYVSAYRVAAAYVALNEKDKAFEWLDRAYDDRDGWLSWLNCDPVMRPLRGDERFAKLVHRVGLSPTESSTQSVKLYEHPISIEGSSHTQRWRIPAVRTLAIVALVPILAALVIYFLTIRFRNTTPPRAIKSFTFTQLTDQPGPEFFPTLSPDGRSVAYASHASGNWDIYLQRVGGRNPINLTKDSPADDSQPAFSPDGERIAFRSERDGGGIYLMGATGESLVRVSDLGYSPSWSPDGKQLIVGTEKIPQPSTRPTTSQLWIIDIDTGQHRMISEGDALQPSWSPHKQRIAYWSRPPKYGQREAIYTIPAGGGAPVAVTNGANSDVNPVWSPDGKYIYFSSNRGGSVNVWRVAIDESSGATQGEPEAVTTIGASTAALHLSFSRDGRRLAYIAQEEIRNLRKVAFDPATAKVTGEAGSVTSGSMQLWFPDVSPDGKWLTAYSMGQQRHVFVLRTDGSELRDLTNDDYRHFWPRWSPDGQRIAFSSRRTGNYELWVINRDGSGLQQLTQANGAHYSPWSGDGKMIAYSIHIPKNDCVIIDPGTGLNQQSQPLMPLSDPTLSFEGWAWSSDGKKLAGIKHLPNGVHSGIGIYDLETKQYDWLTDFGDWPIWLNDDRHLLFVSQGKVFSFDTKTRKYQPVLTVTDQDVDIGSPGVSPDNRVIYFTFVATEADIWVMNLNE